MSGAPMLEVVGVGKQYRQGTTMLTVLQGVTFRLAAGSISAIVGPSGSGKTTLLGLCAGLDRATEGTVRLDGTDLGPLPEEERTRLRNAKIGFVFQNFQLLPSLTALENVMVPLELHRGKNIRARAERWLARVGLAERVGHYPAQLSGGEQQRVALARAFITEPRILFADEPTGNLDAETGQTIMELLLELNRTCGTTLVLVTHDPELAARTDRILRLRGGRLIADETPVDRVTPATAPFPA